MWFLGSLPPHQRSLSRIRHLPYSRALRVTRPLMPGLEVVVGTQAAIRSRRHSHIPRVAPLSRWTRAGRLPSAPGHLQDPGAGAEHMAEGTRPTQSPQHPHQLRPYIGAHHLTSAPVRTSGPPWCSSHQKPSLAQCVSQRGSRFPSCSPFVSLLGAREGEGPMRHHCRLWAARGWGHHHRPALVSQQEGTAHRDVQGPSSATVPCLGTTEEQKDGTTRGREMQRGCARGWVQALCSHSHLGEGCGSYRVRKPQDTAGSPRRRVTGRQGQSEREQNSVVPPKAPAGAEELSSEPTAGGEQPTPSKEAPGGDGAGSCTGGCCWPADSKWAGAWTHIHSLAAVHPPWVWGPTLAPYGTQTPGQPPLNKPQPRGSHSCVPEANPATSTIPAPRLSAILPVRP